MSAPTGPDASATPDSDIAALLRSGRPHQAASAAEAALEHAPQSPDLWSLLAAARVAAGELLTGWRACLRALELDPGCAAALETRSLALEMMAARYRGALGALAAGGNDAARLEAAYAAVADAHEAGVLEPAAEGVALALFLRLAATEEADRRWPFEQVGRALAARGEHRHLIHQLPRVRSDADRRELLAQHRLWGEGVEAQAAGRPVRPPARTAGDRPRVAFVSSDLRLNAAGVFTYPLIEHAAAEGVELVCYSAHPGPPDAVQAHFAARAAGFRHMPGADADAIARAVAADAPDVVIEIGGSTNANRLEALAHRLAPAQMSWLGYPHSAGLSTIDRLVLDPHLAPAEPGLILEQPLVLPKTWVAMPSEYFHRGQPLAAEPPQARNGVITFGTAGSPYKYSARSLRAWARVLAAVPGSRLLIVRPEGASAVFRANVSRWFLAEGVKPDRLRFAPVWGGHLPHYGEIDIALDTFPLTGGTTTCEALWSGVPVVTLAGKAPFERLSHSLLQNAGLGDLSAASEEAFVETAVALAHDLERLRHWRAKGRDLIEGGPLGDPRGFARDFWGAVTGVL